MDKDESAPRSVSRQASEELPHDAAQELGASPQERKEPQAEKGEKKKKTRKRTPAVQRPSEPDAKADTNSQLEEKAKGAQRQSATKKVKTAVAETPPAPSSSPVPDAVPLQQITTNVTPGSSSSSSTSDLISNFSSLPARTIVINLTTGGT